MDYATGEYRLVRQGGGRGAYAHVRVVVRPADAGAGDRVRWAVDPADSGSAQPPRDLDLARAALDGVAAALADLDGSGVDTRGHVVEITSVGMNVVDTEPTAVRAAAAAATVAAFGRADRFEVIFDDGWQFRAVR